MITHYLPYNDNYQFHHGHYSRNFNLVLSDVIVASCDLISLLDAHIDLCQTGPLEIFI